ncbi:MAG: glycosyltransferase family 39 protein [Bacteroidetes bacterium]|jgi:hypothetical protein|nr:glycosyltransferase family 39 protein [Bacteroidota bacterium]
MEDKSTFRALAASPLFIPALFAGLKLIMHLLANAFAPFELFRDELYYIVSTDHLEAGYVDHPPLSIWILAVSRMLFGDSVFAIRALPAFAGAAAVFLTGMMVREMGGGRMAQAFACAASLLSLAVIAASTFYSMNAWDMLFWSLALLLTLQIAREATMRRWGLLGVVLGLGLLNKISVLWLGAGLFAGLLLTPHRSELRSQGPWIAGGIALLFFVPYILWNAANDWAHLEFIRNASSMKYGGLDRLDVLLGQITVNNPATLPLWLAGLVFFFTKSGRPWRIAGVFAVTVMLILIVNGTSKPEYFAPAVPVLFAGGAVALTGLRHIVLRRVLHGTVAVMFALSVGSIPIVLPILSAERFTAYASAIGFESKSMESQRLGTLPQFYADMHGWKDLAATVDTVYRSLSDEERSACVIYARNYGQASAITFYGRPYGLPAAVSGHNSYFLWGPGPVTDPRVVIIVGGRQSDHERGFEEVTIATVYSSPHIMPYEDHKPIYVCRGPKTALGDLWKSVKLYI